MPRQSKQIYELVFTGSADASRGPDGYKFPRYKRFHDHPGAALEEAWKVHDKLRAKGLPTACHIPLVFQTR